MQSTNIKPVMFAKTEVAALRRDVCLAPLSGADPLREARRSSGPYQQVGQTLRWIQGLL